MGLGFGFGLGSATSSVTTMYSSVPHGSPLEWRRCAKNLVRVRVRARVRARMRVRVT